MKAEHPCACGADQGGGGVDVPAEGASPRVRGRQGREVRVGRRERSIPARAGPTLLRGGRGREYGEHPRACGADVPAHAVVGVEEGASPRVRGRLWWRHHDDDDDGSIPARAGPTGGAAGHQAGDREHPRACGADEEYAAIHGGQCGASPRVRGRRSWARRWCARRRSIPARAGPTSGWSSSSRWAAEHPRACGADGVRVVAFARSSGASPRVRGRRRGAGRTRGRGGSIPARAGPTSGGRRPQPAGPEHPRACGADSKESAAELEQHGASPRVRGRQDGDVQVRVPAGSIPARAGPTRRRRP